jgi:hypothetical protein
METKLDKVGLIKAGYESGNCTNPVNLNSSVVVIDDITLKE